MSVMIDHEPLETVALGLTTVGHVLSKLRRDNRLVVHVLIDGQEPDLADLAPVRRTALAGRTVFIETADPRQLAGQVLAEMGRQLADADRLKFEAAEAMQRGHVTVGLEKLGGCFAMWQNAQKSVLGAAQVLGLDPDAIDVAGRPLSAVLLTFTAQLKSIKIALENRDFVTVGDLLLYETTQTTRQWLDAAETLRADLAA